MIFLCRKPAPYGVASNPAIFKLASGSALLAAETQSRRLARTIVMALAKSIAREPQLHRRDAGTHR
jgi:hypothetical protein